MKLVTALPSIRDRAVAGHVGDGAIHRQADVRRRLAGQEIGQPSADRTGEPGRFEIVGDKGVDRDRRHLDFAALDGIGGERHLHLWRVAVQRKT